LGFEVGVRLTIFTDGWLIFIWDDGRSFPDININRFSFGMLVHHDDGEMPAVEAKAGFIENAQSKIKSKTNLTGL
jgi:hypothetical protein